MNLVVISGRIGDIEKISERPDGSCMVDGYLLKTYYIDGVEHARRFNFTVTGKKAKCIIDDYRIGDNVVLNGKLITTVDDEKRVWTTIVITSMAKLEDDEVF